MFTPQEVIAVEDALRDKHRRLSNEAKALLKARRPQEAFALEPDLQALVSAQRKVRQVAI